MDQRDSIILTPKNVQVTGEIHSYFIAVTFSIYVTYL